MLNWLKKKQEFVKQFSHSWHCILQYMNMAYIVSNKCSFMIILFWRKIHLGHLWSLKFASWCNMGGGVCSSLHVNNSHCLLAMFIFFFCPEVSVSKNKHWYNGWTQVSLSWNDQRKVVLTSLVVIIVEFKLALHWVRRIKERLYLLHREF